MRPTAANAAAGPTAAAAALCRRLLIDNGLADASVVKGIEKVGGGCSSRSSCFCAIANHSCPVAVVAAAAAAAGGITAEPPARPLTSPYRPGIAAAACCSTGCEAQG